MQPSLWEHVAAASNDYFRQKNLALEKKKPQFKAKEREKIKEEQNRIEGITARELCVFIGLLVARTVAPNKEKWKTTGRRQIKVQSLEGALVNSWFMRLSRNLRFSDNTDQRALIDRAWKIRSVIAALQQQFQLGYTPPPTMAFDEAMLSSQSSFNRMRVFMKDKPHRWGTKLFMLCCSTIAYCIRFEVYCGKQELPQRGVLSDYNSGPAAVMRNLREVIGLEGPGTGEMRLIATDRFYTSVSLAMQMLTLGFYSIGTKEGENKKKKPPKKQTSVYQERDLKIIKFHAWWDNKAFYMLASGGSVEMDRVERRNKQTGQQAKVACPRVLKDYEKRMGGVDVHDQLRLQRYSLQLAIKYKKYYKSLFLGLVDLAVINAYIVFNDRRAGTAQKINYVKFLKQLHLELCQLRDEDWEGLLRNITSNRLKRLRLNRARIRSVLSTSAFRMTSDGRAIIKREGTEEHECARVLTTYKVETPLSIAVTTSSRHPLNGRRRGGCFCVINLAANTTAYQLPA
ncbi:Hypothetical protein PHPALM_11638 [Phytophthora palmivora]|uniref:PiggyBac transposable element-derived protein domain-containing protein n=1 Tax=Phytophthora palmivora TaxID=4796 RepID=A0A2P4Y204_9STRA|nr:Hypothetical protein PHPALM_11638 [Phytophthora palmivora]